MKLLYNLENKMRKFCVMGLMKYIVAACAVVYVANLIMPGANLYGQFALIRAPLLGGQIWRLVTFLFVPPSASLVLLALTLYCYWLVGTHLEIRWGRVKFNLFYWFGALGAIITALITGYADSFFINLSLLFVFTVLYPDVQFMVFFIIPVKARYLALLNALYYVFAFVTGGWSTRLMILFSLGNVFLFVGGDLSRWYMREKQYWKTRYNFRRNMR